MTTMISTSLAPVSDPVFGDGERVSITVDRWPASRSHPTATPPVDAAAHDPGRDLGSGNSPPSRAPSNFATRTRSPRLREIGHRWQPRRCGYVTRSPTCRYACPGRAVYRHGAPKRKARPQGRISVSEPFPREAHHGEEAGHSHRPLQRRLGQPPRRRCPGKQGLSHKAAAQAAGRETARRERTEHIIHKKDGEIGSRNSYGNDPHPPKG
jgi:hypothetical protein